VAKFFGTELLDSSGTYCAINVVALFNGRKVVCRGFTKVGSLPRAFRYVVSRVTEETEETQHVSSHTRSLEAMLLMRIEDGNVETFINGFLAEKRSDHVLVMDARRNIVGRVLLGASKALRIDFEGYAGSVKGFRPGKKFNEDCVAILGVTMPSRKIVAALVADGVTAVKVGAIASTVATYRFLLKILEDLSIDRFRLGEVPNIVEEVNHELYYSMGGGPSYATTFTAIVFENDRGILVHAGDSRAYLVRKERLKRLTTDHRYGNTKTLTKAMGVTKPLNPEIRMLSVCRGCTYVLCSDGMYETVGEDTIARVATRSSAFQAVSLLIKLATYRKVLDDASVAIVKRW